ncbi:MAG: COX15/CtaA family protein [Thaumarchaeota archaeon]|nr:COX15/CtaA family protein [Nitrososphaerota archaeon]
MDKKTGLLILTLSSLFSLVVVGAYVAARGYGEACGSDVPADWPLCLGNLLPPPQVGPVVEYTHRLLAALSTLFLAVTAFVFWRDQKASGPEKRMLGLAVALLIGQVLLGGVVVAQNLEAGLVALHQAIAILIFGLVVAALAVGGREG